LTLPANNSGIVHGNVRQDDGGTTPWLVAEEGQALRFDGAASPILYLGTAAAGADPAAAVWRIQQIDTTSGVVMLWADGNTQYDNVWNDRASLSYS
jgi:hypothetical protein